MSINITELEQRASQFLQRGKIERALKEYSQILQHDPRNRRVRLTIAELHLKMGQNKQAERRYLEVVEGMVKEGKYSTAVPLYKTLIKLRPKDHEMQVELADCLLRSNLPNDALVCLKKAVEMTQRMKPEVAQDIQRRIIELNPGELQERRKLAELLEAANWMDKSSDEWLTFAEINRRLERFQEAALATEKAVSLREDWSVRAEAAQARLVSEEPRLALQHLQRIPKAHAKEPRVLALLADGLTSVGRSQQASQLWLQAARRYDEPLRKVAAYEQAIECGVPADEVQEEFEAARLGGQALTIRLTACSWAKPQSDTELRFVTQAQTFLDYGQPNKAYNAITAAEGMQKRPSIFAMLVECNIAVGDVDDAIELLEGYRSNETNVSNDIALRLLGLREEEDDSEELIDDELLDDDLDSGLEEEIANEEKPVNVDQLIAEAEQIAAQGDVDRAVNLLGKVLEVDPTNETAATRIGELYMSMDDENVGFNELLEEGDYADINPSDFAPAIPEVEEMPDFSFADADASVAEPVADSLDESGSLFNARARYLVGMYKEAQDLLTEEDGPDAGILLAQVRIAMEKYRSAVGVLQDTIESLSESDPRFVKALWLLAKAYTLQQKIRSAIRTLDELEDISPDYRQSEIEAWRVGLELLRE